MTEPLENIHPLAVRETGTQVQKAAQPLSMSNYARLVNLFGYGVWSDEASGPIDLERVIKLSSALVALDVLSQDISKVDLQLRRRLPNGGSEVVMPGEHWLARMLADRPNEHHTWGEFIEMVVLHLASVKNAYIGKVMTVFGKVEQLVPILPGRVRIYVDPEEGLYFYDVDRNTPHEQLLMRAFADRFLLGDEVIHIRGRMFDGLFGYSNLEAGSAVFALASAVQDYQTRLYKNDAILRGVFTMPNEEVLGEAAFRRLKEQLGTLWTKMRNTGAPIVLEQGMTFSHVAMNADQAETAKAKANAIEDVARVFRIPPHKMMHIVNVKYENMETLEKSYVQDTLIPIAQAIERKMGVGLMTAEERQTYFLQFDREAMVLTDVKAQAEIMGVLLDRGVISHDEARMKRGYNPKPNGAGKVFLIPANYALVDEANNVVLPAGNGGGQQDSGSQSGENSGDSSN